MQNKGFVKVFAILLTLVCVFYLSFSFVTRYLFIRDPLSHEQSGRRPERRGTLS